jgi:hypothetical protein
MQTSDRFLSRIAALRERDVRFVESGFGWEDRVVELAAPRRYTLLDPQPLELAGIDVRLDVDVELLACRREAFLVAPHERRRVLLGLDLALRRETRA